MSYCKKIQSYLFMVALTAALGTLFESTANGQIVDSGGKSVLTDDNRPNKPEGSAGDYTGPRQPVMRVAALSYGLKGSVDRGTQGTSIDKTNSAERTKTRNVATSVFSTVAIPFSKIGSRPKWLRIQLGLHRPISGNCLSADSCNEREALFKHAMDQIRDANFYSKLVQVNTTVNKLISYKADQLSYGTLDYWATLEETISKGEGDCEDFANLKLALLTKLGIPSRSMSLVVLKDMQRNIFHAVLAVSTNKGNFILDNVRDEILPDTMLREYLPLYSFSGNRSWIHGIPRGHDMIAKMDFGSFERITPGEQFEAEPIDPLFTSNNLLMNLRPTFANDVISR